MLLCWFYYRSTSASSSQLVSTSTSQTLSALDSFTVRIRRFVVSYWIQNFQQLRQVPATAAASQPAVPAYQPGKVLTNIPTHCPRAHTGTHVLNGKYAHMLLTVYLASTIVGNSLCSLHVGESAHVREFVECITSTRSVCILSHSAWGAQQPVACFG